MTIKQTKPDLLDEKQIAEIEATVSVNAPLRAYLSQFNIDIPALIQTVRAAWKERDAALVRAAEDQDYNSEQRAALAKENATLREQLAENARRHFDDARRLEHQRNEVLDQWASCDEDTLAAEMNTVATTLVREWRAESSEDQELIDELAVTLTHAHMRAEANTATAMRDKCVEKVKELRDAWESKRNEQPPLSKLRNRYDAGFCAANEVITALESLTLEAAANSVQKDSEPEGEGR